MTDRAVLIAEADSFVQNYQQLIAKHNQDVEAGVASSPEDFIAKERNPLVASTFAKINGRMSVFGVSTFNSYVQDFRSHIRTSEVQ